MADLDTIMSGSGSDSATEQTPAVETTEGQPRDPHGRFASQERSAEQAAQPAAVEQQEQRPPDGFIPIQALDARLAKERERADAALRQQAEQFQRMILATQQQARPAVEPPKAPDFFENPDAAVDFRLKNAMQPVQQGQQAIVENFSKMMATEKFGEEAVNSAFGELASRLQSNPRAAQFDYQRIMSSPHPYGELVKWHKAQTVTSKYGDESAIEAEVERRLAERQQQAPNPAAQAAPAQAMPQSFTQARSPGGGAAPQWSGPVPLSELMGR